jgi:hypothetical protein
MDEPWKQYVKWNKLETKGQILYEIPTMGKSIEMGVEWRLWGEKGYRASVKEDERTLQTHWW